MRQLKVILIIVIAGCSNDRLKPTSLFSDLTSESGITFSNNLSFTRELNPYTYRNFYNGAGVAIGDINNDGLLDVYFAANQAGNKLYLNEGSFKFKDITQQAGVECRGVWSTGVTMVDINADGLLDIYVCKSGNPGVQNRNNELFINNGDLSFTEKSKEYGLDVTGLSVQAAFFDYDRDGDLDCYLLTNSFKSIGNYDLIKSQREIPDPQGAGNKFLINENGKFRDYSAEARIYRSNIGFGLGITLGDFNNDSWTDIFVSNDFFERDYLYINDQLGSFRESLTEYFQSISMGSMGADFADLDNDGVRELFVTEMLPDSLSRKKTKTVYENWNKYQLNIQNDYHHQFSRNVLQKRTSDKNYVEVGRLAGIAASEWSWGALLFDMNNDGRRDIFIANGIYKDLLDRDYLTYSGAEENIRKIILEDRENAILNLINLMPSSTFTNYAFRNEGNLTFHNAGSEWGFNEAMFSSGSAYGDLDNDGDLDLVLNNINSPSKIYRNNADSSTYKSVTLVLTTGTKNALAVGAEVTVYCEKKTFIADNFVTRGFQSSVQPNITIGLGKEIHTIDSILIQWPDGGLSTLTDIPINRKTIVRRDDVKVVQPRAQATEKKKHLLLQPVRSAVFKHNSSGLTDFNRDRLLPMMYSNETPSFAKGDIDGDGVEEIYVGGGKDQPGAFIQFRSGQIKSYVPGSMRQHGLPEETKGALVDLDNDGDLDLYMACGGRFFPRSSSALVDKVFINNGKGDFTESQKLPVQFISTSVVKPIDFDRDNDQDLLIGERFDPFVYGRGGSAYLLENDGNGAFRDVTRQYAPDLTDIGMVTDIEVQDFNNDGSTDIVIVGDWMPIVFLRNDNRSFTNVSAEWGLKETRGWWHGMEASDFNKDGKIDFVLGNHGLNSFFKASDRMYVNDFDGNGSVEQIFCTKVDGKYYPIADKDDFLSQLPSFKKELLYYRNYGKRSIGELVPKNALESSKIFEVDLLASILLLSNDKGYNKIELPLEAQYSPIYGLLVADFDQDGIDDLIAGGNQYQVKPQFGRFDASNGWFFKGAMTNNTFSFLPGEDLNVKGQIRDIEHLEVNKTYYILFAKHNDELEILKILR